MKKMHLIILTMSLLVLAFTNDTIAQNFCKTDPGFHKILVDNDVLTATEVTFEPGKKTNVHTHSAALVYALTGGTLLVKFEDGKTETIELKAGDSAYQEPERPHMTENIGKTTMKVLLIELKDKPYMAEKKMK